jgi:hypothetical protein
MKLATTNKYADSEIIQLSAVCGESTFREFIMPQERISHEATKRHKISKVNGILQKTCAQGGSDFYLIRSDSAAKVFGNFVYWLDNLKVNRHDNVRLISHGMNNFHAHVLVIIF